MLSQGRITLRHVAEEDLPHIVRALSDLSIRGVFTPTRMTSPHEARRLFDADGFSSDERELFLVCDEQMAVIGQVVHFRARRYSTSRELGWMIYDTAHRGRGYASEAVGALVDYLFRSQPIHRIECTVNPANLASAGVARRCGFVHEGRLRGLVHVEGEYTDGDVYAIVRDDWRRARGVDPIAP